MPLSGFHPTISKWFSQRFGSPTQPQREGWPRIRAGLHTLIAAPTGTGKTLAAFLSAINDLARLGDALPSKTRVLYVSPLRALSNDVQKNLSAPLAELTALDPEFPEIRVLVRTGDTPQRDRTAMIRTPPHILVTTPESLYILLTSNSGQDMLRTVRTVIVDEIHTLVRDKRGSHLALSLERLEALTGRQPGRGVPLRMQRERERFRVAAGRDRGQARGSVQRIGLSATQKPLRDVARFLVGVGRECELVDVGHRRQLDVAVEVPPSPLSTVCSHEQWSEIYRRIAELINEHRTTLVFVNTRKLAERVAARLTDVLGEEQVTCHHSSLSRERRLDAEQRLKAGTLKALVATASLELGIDIGDVDLAIQVGTTNSIATFLQRVGRSGHAVRGTPKGRLFPLTIDELIEAAAILRCVARGELDRTPHPTAPLDILAQQIVAACVAADFVAPTSVAPTFSRCVGTEKNVCATGPEGWYEDDLFGLVRRSWPYRDLNREDFDAVIAMHSEGRRALLHRDGVNRRVMAKKRARIPAITSGGAIPDVADFQVLMEPEGLFVGTVNEDFAVESNAGDIFQLGNTSWRILKIERGVLRVADAKGQPPSVPFWLGEGPSRTTELSHEIGAIREIAHDPAVLQREIGLSPEASVQVAEFLQEGRRVLGTVPTQQRVILERFFDESGGMQMVLHAPFGGRINRAWGLALRKKFCRGFGYELQAAANEEAIVVSLGLQHSFPLEDVFNYLHPNSVRETLTQAVLDQPMFESRWRWNATRSLVLEKFQHGKRVPPAIMRMRAADLLASTFPAAVACPENLPAGDLPIPMDHPLVRQTIDDCLTEATDIDGLIHVLTELRNGKIDRVAVDTPEPSALAQSILASKPYSFLDDAPLEERRTQAVLSRRTLDPKTADQIGALDPAAVQRVREEAWPQPENAEEVHEALLWIGFLTDQESAPWSAWLDPLANQKRVIHEAGRWFAADGTRDPRKILLGRLEALGPVFESDPRIALPDDQTQQTLFALERDGAILRTRFEGQTAWCERRLLARIHRYTLDALRREIEPVSAIDFLRFLARWQHLEEGSRLEGPRGAAEILTQLAGFEAPAWAWESSILPRRLLDYRREWLDELTLSGEFVWGRLWGSSASAIRVTPIALIRREDMDMWLNLTKPPVIEGLSGAARDLLDVLCARGAMFPQELQKAAKLPAGYVELGLADLVSHGLVTCDSFAALRQIITPPSRRKRPVKSVGRWSALRHWEVVELPLPALDPAEPHAIRTRSASDGRYAKQSRDLEGAERHTANEFLARQMLQRTGVVFRKMLDREKLPATWSSLVRVYRTMELRGEIRGGRFVAGFAGEQFAFPQAVELLRKARRSEPSAPISVASADPLNYEGILTPADRISPTVKRQVMVG